MKKILFLALLFSGATQASTDLILDCKNLSSEQTASSHIYLLDVEKSIAGVLFDTKKESLLLQVEDQFYRLIGQLDGQYGTEKDIVITINRVDGTYAYHEETAFTNNLGVVEFKSTCEKKDYSTKF